MQSSLYKYILRFKTPSGTSRGILDVKESYFFVLNNKKNRKAVGEASLIKGLSYDAVPAFYSKAIEINKHFNVNNKIEAENLKNWPALRFAIEMAMIDLQYQQTGLLFPSAFTDLKSSIPINGLVWMGSYQFMQQQIKTKIDDGYKCIKLKIGAINFEDEIRLLQKIRTDFVSEDIMIRVDANGAFSPGKDAMYKLDRLSKLDVHSIEQPIRQGQIEEMTKLCANTPLPIALDEELIGIFETNQKRQLLETIKPQYIILKPSFLGGFKASEEWIDLADNLNIGWWITSALESNIGLNAIAQWTATLNTNTFQGLGTGNLFANNITAPLYINNGNLFYDANKKWDFSNLI